MKKSMLYMGTSLLISDLLFTQPGQQDIVPAPTAAEVVDTVEIETVEQCKVIVPHYEPREFTFEEAQMLMRIAQAEAGNQGIKGMELVMAVVLNRVEDESFPDTIEDVIFQKGQFQPVEDGKYYDVEISPEAHLALAEVEKGKLLDTQIIGFEITSNSRTLERYFKFAYTVGGHDFYVKKCSEWQQPYRTRGDYRMLPAAAGGEVSYEVR